VSIAVGVDGGGTSARAVIVDSEGRELARADAPGAVVAQQAPEAAAAGVEAAIREAARRARVPLPADVLWAGLAGAGREPARAAVRRELERRGVAARVLVGTDVEAAFEAAFAGGSGILLVAGTGSIAWARDAGGGTSRAGGWGQLLGDEGSGYAIGLAALRAAVRAADGRGPETRLREAVPAALSLADPDDLVPWVAAAAKADVARLVPVVVEAAARGDAVADALLGQAGAELARHVEALLARMPSGSERPQLALWGGLLAEGGPLRGRVLERLREMPVDVRPGALDPALGAARLALQAHAER